MALLIKEHTTDILVLVCLSILAFLTFGGLLQGEYIHPGYFDWINQAFRVKLINNFGLTNWNHFTGGGQDVWQAFQFAPHYITSEISRLIGISITQSMLIVSFILLNFFLFSLYLVLTSLGVRKDVAFIFTVPALGILQITTLIGDFSILWGFAFLPLVFGMVLKSFEKWNIFHTLILAGTFVFHPILGFFCSGLWVLNIIVRGYDNLRFHLLNLVIFLMATSYYWVPAFFYTGIYYLDESQTTSGFVRGLIFRVNYGLSYGLTAFLAVCGLILMLKIRSISELKNRTGIFLAMIYIFLLMLFVVLTYQYELPHLLNTFQITRWIPFMVVALILVLAVSINSTFSSGNLPIFAFLAAVSIWIVIESTTYSYTSLRRYTPVANNIYEDPVSVFINEYPDKYDPLMVVYTTNSIEAQYFNFGKVKTERGYFHFSQNKLLSYIHEVERNANTTINALDKFIEYFYARGVKYVIVPQTARLHTLFQNAPTVYSFEEIGNIKLRRATYTIYKISDEPFETLIIDKQSSQWQQLLNMSEKDYHSYSSVINIIQEFNDIVSSPENKLNSVDVNYEDPESLIISELPTNSVMVINTNYDTNWKVVSHNGVDVKEAGPGYTALVNNGEAKSGIEVKRQTPQSNVWANRISLLGMSLALIWYGFTRLIQPRKAA